MDRVFAPTDYFTVPDGTDVSAFLNATDVTQKDVPWGALGELSIASGRVRPGVNSWVHVHPVVTQVTYVVSGGLTVRMKDPGAAKPYDKALTLGQAVVSQSGTLFQLRNHTNRDAFVLYIASPSYLFYMDGDQVIYDDAILVSETWEELEVKEYRLPVLEMNMTELRTRRDQAALALQQRKGRSAS